MKLDRGAIAAALGLGVVVGIIVAVAALAFGVKHDLLAVITALVVGALLPVIYRARLNAKAKGPR